MGIRHGQESAYIQERRKWETQPVMVDAQWVTPQMIDGKMRPGFMDGTYIQPLSRADGGCYPYVHQEYPKMLYRAGRPTGTNIDIIGHLIVDSDVAERLQVGQGWCATQEGAIARVQSDDQEAAVFAANRNFNDRRMSEKAQGESLAAQETSSQHLGAIPETPIRRRQPRKPKAAPAATEQTHE